MEGIRATMLARRPRPGAAPGEPRVPKCQERKRKSHMPDGGRDMGRDADGTREDAWGARGIHIGYAQYPHYRNSQKSTLFLLDP